MGFPGNYYIVYPRRHYHAEGTHLPLLAPQGQAVKVGTQAFAFWASDSIPVGSAVRERALLNLQPYGRYYPAVLRRFVISA